MIFRDLQSTLSPLHALDQVPRHADVEHVQTAEIGGRLGGEKPVLAATNVQVSAARTVWAAGVPVSQSNPLGKSTASFGAPAALSRSITASSGGSGLAAAAGPQQRIDDPSGPVERPRRPRRSSSLSPNTSIGASVLVKMRKLAAASPASSSGLAQSSTRRSMAAEIEVPGNHESVARIIALPAADRDRPADAQPAQHVGHAPARVLHQHQPGKAELLDREPIDQP